MQKPENIGLPALDFISFLAGELERRRKKNPQYSLRAFSRSLNYDVASLSGILSSKRPLTAKAVSKLAANLGLTKEQTEYFSEQAMKPRLKLDNPELISDAEAVLTEWFHFQLLELIRNKDFSEDFSWMANQTGVTENAAREGWQRLIRLGLLKAVGNKWTDQLSLMRFKKRKTPPASTGVITQEKNCVSIAVSEETLVELLVEIRKFHSRLKKISAGPAGGFIVHIQLSGKTLEPLLQKSMKQKH